MNWEVTSTTNDGKTITKKLVGHVDNSSYPQISVNILLTLVTPAKAKGPVPVMMQFNGGPFMFRRPRSATRPGGTTRLAATPPRGFGGFGGFGNGPNGGPNWMQLVLAKGWGYATINTSSIQADNGRGLTQGIINRQCAIKDSRGRWMIGASLKAWAWGASRTTRIILKPDDRSMRNRLGSRGTRGGEKVTLVAMAYDPRFAIAYVSSLGRRGS